MKDENKNELSDQVDDLIKKLENSDDPQDNGLAEKAKKLRINQKEFEKSVANLQESLDYLRICVKYQVFDLEATRRENEYLRKLLESKFDDEEPSG